MVLTTETNLPLHFISDWCNSSVFSFCFLAQVSRPRLKSPPRSESSDHYTIRQGDTTSSFSPLGVARIETEQDGYGDFLKKAPGLPDSLARKNYQQVKLESPSFAGHPIPSPGPDSPSSGGFTLNQSQRRSYGERSTSDIGAPQRKEFGEAMFTEKKTSSAPALPQRDAPSLPSSKNRRPLVLTRQIGQSQETQPKAKHKAEQQSCHNSTTSGATPPPIPDLAGRRPIFNCTSSSDTCSDDAFLSRPSRQQEANTMVSTALAPPIPDLGSRCSMRMLSEPCRGKVGTAISHGNGAGNRLTDRHHSNNLPLPARDGSHLESMSDRTTTKQCGKERYCGQTNKAMDVPSQLPTVNKINSLPLPRRNSIRELALPANPGQQPASLQPVQSARKSRTFSAIRQCPPSPGPELSLHLPTDKKRAVTLTSFSQNDREDVFLRLPSATSRSNTPSPSLESMFLSNLPPPSSPPEDFYTIPSDSEGEEGLGVPGFTFPPPPGNAQELSDREEEPDELIYEEFEPDDIISNSPGQQSFPALSQQMSPSPDPTVFPEDLPPPPDLLDQPIFNANQTRPLRDIGGAGRWSPLPGSPGFGVSSDCASKQPYTQSARPIILNEPCTPVLLLPDRIQPSHPDMASHLYRQINIAEKRNRRQSAMSFSSSTDVSAPALSYRGESGDKSLQGRSHARNRSSTDPVQPPLPARYSTGTARQIGGQPLLPPRWTLFDRRSTTWPCQEHLPPVLQHTIPSLELFTANAKLTGPLLILSLCETSFNRQEAELDSLSHTFMHVFSASNFTITEQLRHVHVLPRKFLIWACDLILVETDIKQFGPHPNKPWLIRIIVRALARLLHVLVWRTHCVNSGKEQLQEIVFVCWNWKELWVIELICIWILKHSSTVWSWTHHSGLCSCVLSLSIPVPGISASHWKRWH